MTRINVYREVQDEPYGPMERQFAGWFESDKADHYNEATEWDGNNWISVPTGSQWAHQMLYRTAQGRWVLHAWSQWQGSLPSYVYVTDDQAKQWLIENDEDAAVAQWFGPLEEERGPGRPEVGQPINVRLGADLLTKVDSLASDAGISRAEMIRRLVTAAV